MAMASSLQPTCYVQAVSECLGQKSEVEYTVLVKTKTPKIQRLRTHRSDADCRRLGDLVETIQRAVDLEIFYPVENPLNCGSCPFRPECRTWQRASSILANPTLGEVPLECMTCSPN